jgi:hypothetical protein
MRETYLVRYNAIHHITRRTGIGHFIRREIDEAVITSMHDAFDGVHWRWMGQHAVLYATHESEPVFRVLVKCVGAELHHVSDNKCDTSPPGASLRARARCRSRCQVTTFWCFHLLEITHTVVNMQMNVECDRWWCSGVLLVGELAGCCEDQQWGYFCEAVRRYAYGALG